MLKVHFDWLLELGISFALYLWASHVGFALRNILMAAVTNKLKSSSYAILSHSFSIYTKATFRAGVFTSVLVASSR